jgi:hypothetical protein
MHAVQSQLGKNCNSTNFRILAAMHSELAQKEWRSTNFRILAEMF